MLTKNTILKKFLIVLITVIMLGNFIMPNYVRADWLEDVAGDIADDMIGGLSALLAKLGDAIFGILQKYVMGNNSISISGSGVEYTLSKVFSNKVTALNANFVFEPNKEKLVEQYIEQTEGLVNLYPLMTYTHSHGVGGGTDQVVKNFNLNETNEEPFKYYSSYKEKARTLKSVNMDEYIDGFRKI